MKRLIAAVTFTAALAAPAHAEFFLGNTLLARCESFETVETMDCLGYITGAADAAQWRSYCPPDGINRGQIRDVVVAFLRQNPDIRHQTADLLVAAALRRVWPCATRPNRGGSV